ncbi:MAG: site-specific integrase [Chloroflexi bacterium]|nr:site-specific integrase [Chloroflexota bacterium]
MTVQADPPFALAPSETDKMILAGQLANEKAAGDVFADHMRHKSEETKKAYKITVNLFSQALAEIHINRPTDLHLTDPRAWRGVTWAMVQGYRDWLSAKGYAIGSINQRLSIIRKMADLAGQAGVIPEDERLRIRDVAGFTRKTGRRVNEQREVTRISNQKDASNFLDRDQVKLLLTALPENPQGRRDQLMVGMFIYLGMRVSELVALSMSDIDLVGGILHIYRQKTDTDSQLDMPAPLRQILREYLKVRPEELGDGRLLAASRRVAVSVNLEGSELLPRAMSKRAVQGRVRRLGQDILGIDDLSPHDMRHSLAETFAEKEISEAAAMDVLGWSTSVMYHHYRKRNKVVSVPNVWG